MTHYINQLKGFYSEFGTGPDADNKIRANYNNIQTTIKRLARIYLGIDGAHCGKCLFDYYIKILIDIKNNKIMKEKKYTIAVGSVFRLPYIAGSKFILTHHNISEDLAKAVLKTQPEAAEKFIRVPENWKEEVDSFDIIDFLKSNDVTQIPDFYKALVDPKAAEAEAEALRLAEEAKAREEAEAKEAEEAKEEAEAEALRLAEEAKAREEAEAKEAEAKDSEEAEVLAAISQMIEKGVTKKVILESFPDKKYTQAKLKELYAKAKQ